MSRSEKYEIGSRKPEVVFASLKEDVERRDLTINSLIKNISTSEILDLTGNGISDLKIGILRTPLNPDITFSEDPLRMMRLVRFYTKFQYKVPMYIIKAIKRNSNKLNDISKERIQEELNKILVSDNASKGIKFLQITGLLKYISKTINSLKGIKQNIHHDFDVFSHTLKVIDKVEQKLENRLAALFHDSGKLYTKSCDENGNVHFYSHEDMSGTIVKKELTNLKYSNSVINNVKFAVENHMRTKQFGDNAEVSNKVLRKLKNDLNENLNLVFDLIDADNNSHAVKSNMPNQIIIIREKINELHEPEKIILPINGFDIMYEFNIKPSTEVGKMLEIVKDMYFENPNITKNEALQKLSLIKRKFKDEV
jgi:tRNA nucleotidyltransferase/poly(A) polymerase